MIMIERIPYSEARKANESDHARSGVCWLIMTWTVCGGWKEDWRKNESESGKSGPCRDMTFVKGTGVEVVVVIGKGMKRGNNRLL